jgi:hypothetical protein
MKLFARQLINPKDYAILWRRQEEDGSTTLIDTFGEEIFNSSDANEIDFIVDVFGFAWKRGRDFGRESLIFEYSNN